MPFIQTTPQGNTGGTNATKLGGTIRWETRFSLSFMMLVEEKLQESRATKPAQSHGGRAMDPCLGTHPLDGDVCQYWTTTIHGQPFLKG
jgi:hypothetical protein